MYGIAVQSRTVWGVRYCDADISLPGIFATEGLHPRYNLPYKVRVDVSKVSSNCSLSCCQRTQRNAYICLYIECMYFVMENIDMKGQHYGTGKNVMVDVGQLLDGSVTAIITSLTLFVNGRNNVISLVDIN